jgi:fervidolysin-like protein
MASMKALGASLLFCCVVLAGCGSAPTAPVDAVPTPVPIPIPLPGPPYAAGDVVVGFHDSVNEAQADAMFAVYGLAWRSYFSRRFTFWVEVVSGDPDVHAARLSESPIVTFAERRGNPNGRPDAVYIIVSFNEAATRESAQALIDSMPGLVVSSTLTPPKWGVALVEPGTEQHWIAVLEQEPIVRYAELNWLAYPGGSGAEIPSR